MNGIAMTTDQAKHLDFLCSVWSASNSSIVITDCGSPDAPIVFVNPAFEAMTGYAADEIRGRNCRFLQGGDREQADRAAIRDALRHGKPCECLLRNYRKNGDMFWNKLYLFPARIGRDATTHFVGVQHDVTREMALVGELERKNRELAILSRELVGAQEEERAALALDLHDEFGQRLSSLNMVLHRALPLFLAAHEHDLWKQADSELAALVAMVRERSVSLRPPALDYFGLEPTVRQLLGRQLDGGPAWVFEYAGLPARLPPLLEISVFRIVQAAVTNIVRHARASRVVVELNGGADGGELELVVRDDGIGFDAASWREGAARAGRAGLAGIRERVALLGGTFVVESAPGAGTCITVLIPLAARAGGAG
jgi:PAS domain S-box-containing protein